MSKLSELVKKDIDEREYLGYRKHGILVGTKPNPLWDAYQRALDLAVGLREDILEQETKKADDTNPYTNSPMILVFRTPLSRAEMIHMIEDRILRFGWCRVYDVAARFQPNESDDNSKKYGWDKESEIQTSQPASDSYHLILAVPKLITLKETKIEEPTYMIGSVFERLTFKDPIGISLVMRQANNMIEKNGWCSVAQLMNFCGVPGYDIKQLDHDYGWIFESGFLKAITNTDAGCKMVLTQPVKLNKENEK